VASGHDGAEWDGGPNVIVRVVDRAFYIPLDPNDARMVALQLNRYSDLADAHRSGLSVETAYSERLRIIRESVGAEALSFQDLVDRVDAVTLSRSELMMLRTAIMIACPELPCGWPSAELIKKLGEMIERARPTSPAESR
jgi:hypothetical protein